ncbi:MAG TPA: hypothetical protein VJJ52_00735 [Candidatus Nanoarchaeia archaeon]|nr:hypothetical protein [Candidatus Nanoarchaeia archaeon]
MDNLNYARLALNALQGRYSGINARGLIRLISGKTRTGIPVLEAMVQDTTEGSALSKIVTIDPYILSPRDRIEWYRGVLGELKEHIDPDAYREYLDQGEISGNALRDALVGVKSACGQLTEINKTAESAVEILAKSRERLKDLKTLASSINSAHTDFKSPNQYEPLKPFNANRKLNFN